MIGNISWLNHCLTFKTPTEGVRRYAECGKSLTKLHQMKSQLGQRVVGTMRRIPSTWSKHTSRDCIVWDREEECRAAAVGFSRGGIFHLCQPPLNASAALTTLSRTLYAAATPPPRRHRSRLCPSPRHICIRDRATVLTITKKRETLAEKWHDVARKNFYGAKVSNVPTSDRRISSRFVSFWNLANKIFKIYVFTFSHRSCNLYILFFVLILCAFALLRDFYFLIQSYSTISKY